MKRLVVFVSILSLALPSLCLSGIQAEQEKPGTRGERPRLAQRIEPRLIKKDIIIEGLQREGQVAFESDSILFHYGSPRIIDESRPQLVEIAQALKQAFADPELSAIQTYFVDGHTCNIGTPEDNCRLSWDRAQSAINELVNLGVPRERLSPRGFSYDVPARPNDTESNRRMNRRVVLTTDMAGKKPAVQPCQRTTGSSRPAGVRTGEDRANGSDSTATEMGDKGKRLPKGFKRIP
jgi:outer membrane protein OmpA-like peptidoglycan-associated protein